MSAKLSTAWPRFAALLALLGVALLVLQPVCDTLGLHFSEARTSAVSLAQPGSAPEAACCAELRAGGSALSAEAISGTARALLLAAAALVLAFIAPPLAFSSRIFSPGAAAAPPLSYYARTARILR